MKNIVVLLMLLSMIVFAQLQGSFTDFRDGKVYRITKIGKQTWMAENLNYDTTGSQYHSDKYGRLYDWETAMKICPSGWHLPNNEEWAALIKFSGGKKAGRKLKAVSGWNDDSETHSSGNGTDDYGFAALPGGRGYKDRPLTSIVIGEESRWWSATKCPVKSPAKQCPSDDYASYWYINHYSDRVGDYTSETIIKLYSVRCLKN